MNRDKRDQIKVIVKLMIVGICATLYAWGGIEHKWLRRYIAPVICVSSIYAFSKDWRSIFQLPLMILSLSLGYSGDSTIWKIIRRGAYGLANGISGTVKLVIDHEDIRKSGEGLYNLVELVEKRILIIFHVVLVMIGSILFGVWNPFRDPRIEETVIGLFIFLIPIITVQRKGR